MDVNFSEDEKDKFKKFKMRMTELYGSEANDDNKLCKFLIAREFNLTQAEIMYRKHLQWKKQMKLDSFLEEYEICEVQQKYFMVSFIGFDNEGDIVAYMDVGSLDLKGLMKSERTSEYIKGFLFLVLVGENLLKEQSKKLGRITDKWTIILNFENFSISHALHKPVIDFCFELFYAYEANYPERLKTAFAINTSVVFSLIFNIVKPIFSDRTLGKVKIFGREGWKEELCKCMDRKDVPAFLGGDKTDVDGNPSCLDSVNYLGRVPKHYYFRSPERRLRGKPGVSEYVLKRLEKADITFEVYEPDSKIEWEIETEIGDIAFGLFERKDDPRQLESIIPIHRSNTNKQIERGIFLCKEPGTYILILDNSYSWIREKHIFCRTSVKKSSGLTLANSMVESMKIGKFNIDNLMIGNQGLSIKN